MPNTKKFLDANGLTYFADKLNNYPTNELLGTVIDAIGSELDKKVDILTAEYIQSVIERLYPNATEQQVEDMVDQVLEHYATVEEDMIETILSEEPSSANQYAPINSPQLTGRPTAPTASFGTNTTQIATTAFVQTALSNKVDKTRKIAGIDLQDDIAADELLNALEITPQSYGAIGDGTHDDTVAFQNALNAAAQEKQPLYLNGSFKLTSTVTIPQNSVIFGDGKHSAIVTTTAKIAFLHDSEDIASGETPGFKIVFISKHSVYLSVSAR